MAWTVVETDSYGQLTDDQIIGNALMVRDYLQPRGWTLDAICGACGNLAWESYINPGQWQGGHYEDMSYGYGLGQWTPATKLKDFAEARGLTWRGNGDTQCLMIDEDAGQWHASYSEDGTLHTPPMSYADFKKLAPPVGTYVLATKLWLWYWEDPGYAESQRSLSNRLAWAGRIWDAFGQTPPQPPTPTGGNMPWIYWLKHIS